MKTYRMVKDWTCSECGAKFLEVSLINSEYPCFPTLQLEIFEKRLALPYKVEPPQEGKYDKVALALASVVNEKNKRYGNSAQEPVRIFSKANPSEGMLVRMDDKLSRIKNADVLRKNDLADLMGYLLIYAQDQGWDDFSELVD